MHKTLRYFVLGINLLLGTPLLFAQTKPVQKREVTGIIRDSLNKPIAGATIYLKTLKDTLQATSNAYGFWGFKEVVSAEFLLTVRALGYSTFNRRYFNNDTKALINIPVVRLGIKEEQLETVTISRLKGAHLKGDTTEFWAKDYIVRDYARLEDLLKRMEGITIDNEGSVFYNGERVVKALFNNSQYFKGSVREAMKELPADIVERIQIIDQNATANGAKNLKIEKTVKVMNIVTRADKSAGRMFDLTLEQGTQSRTFLNSSIRKIDASDQVSGNLSFKKEPIGIKDSPVPGTIANQTPATRFSSNVSEGDGKEIRAGVSKSIQFKNFSLTPQYDFHELRQRTGTQSISQNFYKEGALNQINRRNEDINTKEHTFSGIYSNTLRNNTYLDGSFNISYANQIRNNEGYKSQTGIINNLERSIANQKADIFEYQINTSYQGTINLKLKLNTAISSSLKGNNTDENVQIDIFANENSLALPDSSLSQLKNTKIYSFINSINNAVTWSKNKHLKIQSTLNFSSNYSFRDISSYPSENQNAPLQQNLSNHQTAHVFGVPLSIAPEYTFDNGLYMSSLLNLRGQWLTGSLNFGSTKINRYDLFIEPALNIGYTKKDIGNLEIGINQSYLQPNITQLNPDVYYINPYEINVGNPNLENMKRTSYNLRYNNFFSKGRFNISLMSTFSFSDNVIATNRFIELDQVKNTIKTINTYQNLNGGKMQFYRLNLTKILSKINSTINLSASVNVANSPYLAANSLEERSSLQQSYELSVFYYPFKWLELTPNLNYNSITDKNSIAMLNRETFNRVLLNNLKLGLYLATDWAVNLNISQSLYHTSGVMDNVSPFVFNANVEKRIFKRKNALISLVVMDLNHKNIVTNYSSSDLGYTNMITNRNSRYYLFQFSWKPQAWGKSKYDNGQGRKGDGSFIKKR